MNHWYSFPQTFTMAWQRFVVSHSNCWDFTGRYMQFGVSRTGLRKNLDPRGSYVSDSTTVCCQTGPILAHYFVFCHGLEKSEALPIRTPQMNPISIVYGFILMLFALKGLRVIPPNMKIGVIVRKLKNRQEYFKDKERLIQYISI